MIAEGKALDAVLSDLEQSAGRFGAAMTSALTSAVRGGKGLDDILKSAGLRLVDIALSAGLKPLENAVSAGIGSVLEGLVPTAGNASPARGVAPFSDHGGLATPRFLSSLSAQGGAPAGTDAAVAAAGAGLRAGGDTSAGAPPNVVFNVTASDADSFRRSEGQIAAMLTRTVGRGRRGV
ncbi:hypothetical protein ASG25_03390 [Rhizobium sp. Leaf384]|nr:phage tail tape measure protein [Rhizobium sp. Leaf341]KQR78215.1 hypothetical protein ASG03_12870 [Rhizobium sp. Leaf341]KQS77526.1 hypothetical protein ASG58_10940 [Rhizobium sp. Leaf383]KQS81520.1 hypothetical protein ASG25_03390 [Rhizobium sp. Leaf384]